jgi:TP901 family phage tail tape measure protein
VADRTVAVRLRAEIADFKARMGEAAKATEQIGQKAKGVGVAAGKGFGDTLRWVDKNEQHVSALSTKIGLVGIGLTAMAGLAVKSFANFDQAMSSVAATGEDARESIGALRDAALDAGARTVFSATEAANAITELAKAGVSTADILNGGLDGALNLAAAGELEVARAAEIASQTMNQFGLTGADATRIADVLAATAGKAAGEVDDVGLAMKYIGPVAAGLGVSLEETAGTLALLAQNGLLADTAGTGLRGVMMSLTAPTAIAQKTLDDYNISAFDAQDKFVGMESLAGQLQQRLGGLADSERKAALGRIFGNEQITAAEILMREGGDAIADWTAKVDDQGYAADTAATKLDNLKGDLEALGGATETALIKMGEGANGPLRGMVQSVTEAINAFSELPSGVQGAALAIVGGSGLVALGVAGLGKLVVGVSSVKASLETLKISAKTAGGAVAGVGGVLAVATIAVSAWASAQAEAKARTDEYVATLDEFGRVTDETLAKVNTVLAADADNWLQGVFSDPTSLIDRAEKYGLAIEDLQGYILGEADAVDRVTEAITRYNAANDIRDDSTGMIATTNDFTDALDTQANSLTEAERQAGQKALADREAGLAASDATAAVDENASAVEKLAAAQAGGTYSTETYTDALAELIDMQREAAGGVLDLRTAQREYFSALDEADAAIEANGRTLDRTTEAGRANQAALDDLADSGWDVITSMQEQGATQSELQSQMSRTRDDFVALAEKMGMSEGAAEDLADELGLIPENVDVKVAVDTAEASDSVNRWITTNDGRRIKIYVDSYGGRQYQAAPGAPRYYASGGAISGPGTGTSDNVAALLSNGEHVLTASDVAKAGGQAAIYRMRAAIQGGALRFAAGGAVGDARRDVRDADAARTAAFRRARSGGWKDADVAAWEKARDRWEKAVERLERLMEQRQDAITDGRRGDTMERATSSLSGAYGLVDQLRDLAGNEDLSQGQRDSFAERAREAEAAFKRLYGQADRIENRLANARDRVQELASIKASASSALSGGFSIGGLFGQKDAYGYDKPVTGRSILRSAQQYAAKVRRFSNKLSAVQKKLGVGSGPILQELVALGVEEGAQAADAILSMSANEANQLTRAYKDIQKYSDRAGEVVTKGFYKGGLSAAEGLVDGLERKRDAIARKIEAIARRNADAIRRALGLDPLPNGNGNGNDGGAGSPAPVGGTQPLGSSSAAVSASAVRVVLSDAQIDRLGNGLAKAWHENPPRAIWAPAARELGLVHQAGKTAAERLNKR